MNYNMAWVQVLKNSPKVRAWTSIDANQTKTNLIKMTSAIILAGWQCEQRLRCLNRAKNYKALFLHEVAFNFTKHDVVQHWSK